MLNERMMVAHLVCIMFEYSANFEEIFKIVQGITNIFLFKKNVRKHVYRTFCFFFLLLHQAKLHSTLNALQFYTTALEIMRFLNVLSV